MGSMGTSTPIQSTFFPLTQLTLQVWSNRDMMSLYVWLKTHLFMELTELTYLIIDCKFLGFLQSCFVANVAPTENTIVYVKHFFQLNIIGMAL